MPPRIKRLTLFAALTTALAGCATRPTARGPAPTWDSNPYSLDDRRTPDTAAPADAPPPAPNATVADAAVADATVAIDNFTFAPARVTVRAGSSVTWTNRDDVPHTVVANARDFASPALDTDDRFSHRFPTPGTFPYFCSVHPHMTGTVVVR